MRDRTYWRLVAQEHTDDTDATVERVRRLMTDIVSEQLVADVPRCVLLSGGLDSSAVTGLAAARLREQGEQLRTFAVDFVGQEEHFVPDAMRATPDSPYVRDVARLVGSAHEDIVLDAETLSDPAVRRRVVTARDIPAGLGDMDASLFLLFKAIREHSTVALSGESADEVFGGYAWFHDEEAVSADIFPWMAAVRRMAGTAAVSCDTTCARRSTCRATCTTSTARRWPRSTRCPARTPAPRGCARCRTCT